MGVYIKGITKSQLMKVIINSTEFMPDDFEIIEVKTPHGRLIDADELEEDDNWSEWKDGFTSYSRLQINTEPTVIEAEVE